MLALLLLSLLPFADVAVPGGHEAERDAAASAGERRATMYRAMLQALAPMVDAAELQVEIRQGVMRAILPSDGLFAAGKSQLLPEGRKRVMALARALATIQATRLSVIGHTDGSPPDDRAGKTALSSARARAVRQLLAHGKNVVTASGAGDSDPRAPNETDEGRMRNRRIEVLVHVD